MVFGGCAGAGVRARVSHVTRVAFFGLPAEAVAGDAGVLLKCRGVIFGTVRWPGRRCRRLREGIGRKNREIRPDRLNSAADVL